MKKILGTLVLVGFLGMLIVPLSASAASAPLKQCEIKNIDRVNNALGLTGGDKCGKTCIFDEGTTGYNKNCALCCTLNTIYNVTDIIFVALVAISGIMILLGAFSLLFAAGESEKINKGRNYIIYAAVGLAIGFLARAIPTLVSYIGGF